MTKKAKPYARKKKPSVQSSTPSYPILKWAGPIIIIIAFVVLAAWSWRKWTDPLVDFGRELYVPWRITEGSVLYKDIASPYGPLSPYLNAFFFKLFGVSLTTLILCNLAILAGFTAILYRFFSIVADRITASAVCLGMLCVFSFSQYVPISNYNFVTPYSHEAVHGTILAILLLYALYRFEITGRSWKACTAGCCLGSICLTKPEIAVATVAAVIVWAALYSRQPTRQESPSSVRALLVFMLGAMLVPAAFFLFFTHHMSIGEAERATFGGWTPLLGGVLTNNIFYTKGFGLDEAGANLYRLFTSSLKIGLFLLFLFGIDWLAGRPQKPPRAFYGPISISLFIILFLKPEWVQWEEAARPLPLLMLVLIVALPVFYFRKTENRQASASIAIMSAWAVFSLLMLAKMILNSRIYHYGFYLALPAVLILIWALVWFVPSLLSSWPGRGMLFKWLAISVIAAGIVYHLQWSQKYYQLKTYALAQGGDTIMTYPENVYPMAFAINEALDAIGKLSAPSETMVVLPEGVMINYLSRRRNPTPYLNFLPPEMSFYGEGKVLASMKAHSPELIVLVSRDTQEFGEKYFGSDPGYGQQILNWVDQVYIPMKLIGDEPLQEGGVGVRILKRHP